MRTLLVGIGRGVSRGSMAVGTLLAAFLLAGCDNQPLYSLKIALPMDPSPTLAEKLTLLTVTATQVDSEGTKLTGTDTTPLCVVLTAEAGWLNCPDTTCASGGMKSVNLTVPQGPSRAVYAPFHIAETGKDVVRGWLYQSVSTTCAAEGAFLLATEGLNVNIKPAGS